MRHSSHKTLPRSGLLIYPNNSVSAGETITLRGNGFTACGNVVTIGAAVLGNLSSPDGKAIVFQAPAPVGDSSIQGLRYYKVFPYPTPRVAAT
jgi:hypothetical protein